MDPGPGNITTTNILAAWSRAQRTTTRCCPPTNAARSWLWPGRKCHRRTHPMTVH